MTTNTKQHRSSRTGLQARRRSVRDTRRVAAALVLLGCVGISLAETAGSLYVARDFPEHFSGSVKHQRITLLPDGTIFKYSDCTAYADQCAEEITTGGYYAEASLWNPARQQWDTKSVAEYMSDFTSTLTHDGRIVMVGGRHEFHYDPRATTEIYDSHTQTLRMGPTLREPRYSHTATELADGGVLVVGGETVAERTTAGVELITTGGWRKTMRPMLQDRRDHTATRLLSGNILVVGGDRYIQPDELQQRLNPGRSPESTILDTVELYDVANDRWSAMPPLPAPRTRHTATLLPDGRVLVIGGRGAGYRSPLSVAASVLLWNPTANQWSATHDLPRGRMDHLATLLSNGDVLVSGGSDERNAPIGDLVLWDHVTGEWSNAGRAHDRLMLYAHTTALLANGDVLLMPQKDLGEMAVWSPKPEKDPSPNWVSPRQRATITRLDDGRFLMVGGKIDNDPTFYAHIYDPATKRWSDTGEMQYPRVGHRATRLADGRVLVLGGSTTTNDLPYAGECQVPAEIWDPETGKWKLFPALRAPVIGAYTSCPPEFLDRYRELRNPGFIGGTESPDIRGLPDGRVFIGVELSTDADAPRRYSYRTWTPGELPPTQAELTESPRSGGRLILLDDGSLVYVGGRDSSGHPSAELDIFELDSKRWRPAGALRHPLGNPSILDLGYRRLLIFERNGDGPVCTADLWDEDTRSTQAISLPAGFMAVGDRAERRDVDEPLNKLSPEKSWRAIGLSSGQMLLVTQEHSYLSESPYERWETIHNEVEFWPVSSSITSSQNGNVLAFAETPLPSDRRFCESSCTNVMYHGQYAVTEFDSGEKRWHSIFPLAYPETTLTEGVGPTPWPANLTRRDGPFYFLVAPRSNIELKIYSSLWRNLFLAMCLVAAVIYWKSVRSRRSSQSL